MRYDNLLQCFERTVEHLNEVIHKNVLNADTPFIWTVSVAPLVSILTVMFDCIVLCCEKR